MKKILAVFLFVLLTFTGCTSSIRLNKRAIVQTLGLDYSNGEYLATMILYGPADAAGETTTLVTAKGTTLASLFSAASISQGKQMFLGNLRLLVFGQSFVSHGIEDAMSFLGKHQQISASTQIAATMNEAATLIAKNHPSDTLLDTLRTAQKSGNLPQTTMLDLMSKERDCLVPLLNAFSIQTPEKQGADLSSSQSTKDQSESRASKSTASQEEPPPLEFRDTGAILFSDGTAKMILSPETVKGYCWFSNTWKTILLETISPRSAFVANKASFRIRTKDTGAQPIFQVDVEIQCVPVEGTQNALHYKEIIAAQEAQVKQAIDAFFTNVCQQGYDPFGIASRLSQSQRRLAGDNATALRSALYQVTVHCVQEKGAVSHP